ncbi:MAG: anti-sigma regulatory factor [Terriglobia bacterium]
MRPTLLPDDVRVPIASDIDIVYARQKGRELASQLGFSSSELALIATAISELARNIVRYAQKGVIIIKLIERGEKRGVHIVATDNGPGIRNIALAMQDGYSTSDGLGLGLPGVRRLMDEFEVVSKNGEGTTVTIKKWLR